MVTNSHYSMEKTMGLGDKGINGVKAFCNQHRCNLICKGIGLPAASSLIAELEGSGDSHREDRTQDADADKVPDLVQERVEQSSELGSIVAPDPIALSA